MIDAFIRGVFNLSRFRTYLLKRPGPEELLRRPKRILLTRLQNVGDMIVFLPTIRTFRKAYPEAEIRLLVKHPGGIAIVEGCPDIDGLIRVRGKGLGNKIRLIREIRAFRPDLFVISTQDYGRVPWGVLGGARVLIGYRQVMLYETVKREKLPGILYRSPEFHVGESEIRRNLRLAECCGIQEPDPAVRYDWFDAETVRTVQSLLKECETERVKIAISPGTRRAAKAWFPDRFARVADALVEKYQAQIVFVGSPEEVLLIRQIQALMKSESVSMAGKTRLKDLALLLKSMDMLMTLDSGPMHIAAAVGLPFVALFGPGEFAKWCYEDAPERQRNLFSGAECAPCYRMECDDQRCMKEIYVPGVLREVDAVMGLLRKGGSGKGVRT